MNRLDTSVPTGPIGSPEMTALEAADAMERAHGSHLIVHRGNRIIGLLTERDIIEKVLNTGRRPDVVLVDDIMRAGYQRSDGAILLEDAADPEEYQESPLAQVLQGKCEECGVFNLDLADEDGLLVCHDCGTTGPAT